MSDRIKNLASRLGWLLSTSGGSSSSVTGGDAYNYKNTQLLKEGKVDEAHASQANDDKIGAIATGASIMLPAMPHLLGVIANPAIASTTTGALAATGLDTVGLVGGLNQLNNYWNDRKNLTWNDTPGIILSGMSLIPGSSQFTNPKNLKYLADAGTTILNIPKITSASTILNRFAHPIETYKFAKLAKDSARVLPADIQTQAVSDLSKTFFKNSPYSGSKYSLFNRRIAIDQLHYTPGEIAGLGDPTATTNFSRGHEYGHLIEDSARKLGYRVDNFPHKDYNYGTGNVDKEISENFADIVGNTLTGDAAGETSRNISVDRYPYIKNDIPRFSKDSNWKQEISIEDIPENARKFYNTTQKNLQTAIRENDETAIEIFQKQISDFGNKYGIRRFVDRDYKGGILKSQLGDTLPEIPQPSYMPQMPNNIDWVWKPNPNIKFIYDPKVLTNAGLMPVKKFFGKTVLDVRPDGRRRDRVINRIGAYSNLARGKKTIVVNNGGEIKQS